MNQHFHLKWLLGGKSNKIQYVVITSIVIFTLAKTALSISQRIKKQENETENHSEEKIPSPSDGQSSNVHHENNLSFIPSHIRREEMKERKRKEKLEMLSMKSPLYENITMLDPHGTILCKISKKKARWYVKKDLAYWKQNNDHDDCDCKSESENVEQCIILRFEPKKKIRKNVTSQNSQDTSADSCRYDQPNNISYHKLINNLNDFEETEKEENNLSLEEYNKSDKQNICVSCGNTKHHIKHYIVPYTYRKRFPSKYKSHLSHDVVLVCADCYVRCSQYTHIRMKEIEHEYTRLYQKNKCEPLWTKEKNGSKFDIDHEIYQVRSSALALKNWRHKIPATKIQHHESIVHTYLKEQIPIDINLQPQNLSQHHQQDQEEEQPMIVLTPELLQKLIDLDYRITNHNYISSDEIVVRYLLLDYNDNDEDGNCLELTQFIKGWREHFIQSVRPRFMPDGWDVNNPVTLET